MLAGMLVDEAGNSIGDEGVQNLPLRVFDSLTAAVTKLTAVREDPLAQTNGSSTGSPSPSAE
jgi:hypothetical protein